MMIRLVFLTLVIGWGLMGSSLNAAEPGRVEFNREIRPILSNTCFACHGPDAAMREAGLRLDTFEGATAEADSGEVAIVPGDSAASELIARITADDEDLRMPPTDSHKELTAAEINLLKRWIDEGAEYQGHWSFLPVARVAPPKLEANDARAVNAIDQFVFAELAKRGWKPSPQADAATLARRLAFDLTGLPPTPEQVAAFTADPSDASYERLVEELLASPRYGERMAMWWLDLVRYADSVGYHGDQPVNVTPYREWVVRAFNANQPFDQFTTEQLAGDLLPDPSTDQKIATGYNRLGMMTAEGGAQPKEYLIKYTAERVRNLGGTWLGLTTGCCECHDHKFDPLTAKNFYQFGAFFADIQEQGLYSGGNFGPSFPAPTPEQAAELARLDAELAKLKQQLDTPTPELAAAQAAWEKSLGQAIEWVPLTPTSAASAEGATLTVTPEASVVASGANPKIDKYTLTFANLPESITALRLEALPHDSLTSKGPGRAGNGNFVLTELVVNQQTAAGESQPGKLVNPSASFEQKSFSFAGALDGKLDGSTGWAVMPEFGKAHYTVLETEADLKVPADGKLIVEMYFHSQHAQHALGHFRLSAAHAPRPVRIAALDALPENLRAIVALPADQRSEAQRNELAAHYRSLAPALRPLRDQLAAKQAQREGVMKATPSMLATLTVAPREMRVLPRGNWMDNSGEVVEPGVPEFLPQPPAKEGRMTRLDLAHWLVSRDNPLTARTTVNRFWKLLFGAGLAPKLDDLGAQGEWPSHPELLDWLAADFIDQGWDVKRTIKQIVMSSAYRQASLVSPELREQDPANRWLARQGRFRLDAEMVRDNALWISGLLVERIGGPSARPYQPARYWAYLNFPEREWQNSVGDDLYRRGLYTHWQRQYLHPSLLAFDAPSREECAAERVRSNTPLQALVLLNDPTYVEAARQFAELIVRDGGSSPAERLDFAFQRALSRSIKSTEQAVLLELLEKHQAQYQQDPTAAKQLLAVGAKPAAADLDPVELAAWTSVARSILNLHAVITRN